MVTTINGADTADDAAVDASFAGTDAVPVADDTFRMTADGEVDCTEVTAAAPESGTRATAAARTKDEIEVAFVFIFFSSHEDRTRLTALDSCTERPRHVRSVRPYYSAETTEAVPESDTASAVCGPISPG